MKMTSREGPGFARGSAEARLEREQRREKSKEAKKKVKILVVDDDPDFREMLSVILLDKGYEVVTARNGQEAIKKVRDKGYSIIFMDIKMPGMNGVEAYKEIKKMSRTTKTVIMTGYAVEDLVKEAIDAGAYGCLHKPFEMDELLNLIGEITGRQKCRMKNAGASGSGRKMKY